MTVKINKVSPGVKRVLINDPKTYNSLSYKTLSSLLKAFKKLDNDKETRVIILEGAPSKIITLVSLSLSNFLNAFNKDERVL